MKKLLFIIPVVLLFTACHNYQADVAQKESEKQELIVSSDQKDSTISFFINEVNDIEINLSSIDSSKRMVSTSTANPELRKTQIVRINENIESIKTLVQQNKARIAALTKKLKSSGYKISGLEKLIANLNLQIVEKDKQLAELNDKITMLNTTIVNQNNRIAELNMINTEKQQVVDNQRSELNTAYYIIGTSKNLIAKGVLVKEGGFIGLGKSKVMKDNYNSTGFTQVDITQTTTLPLDTKDAKLITTHPTSSYTLKHTDKKHISALVITDPTNFWKASKYLVIVVDK